MFHQDTIQCHGVSYRQIVLIFTSNTLRDPEDDSRKHECDILRDVRIAIVGVLLRVLLEHIFEDQDRHATRKSACHEREADKEDQPCAPDRPTITKALLSANPVLVNQVDNEHTEQRADPGHPVGETDVDGCGELRFIVRRMCVCGEYSSVKEGPIRQCEQTTG